MTDSAAVETVGSYLTGDGPLSETGATVLLPVTLAGSNGDEASANAEILREEVEAIEAPAGFEALVAGPTTLDNDFNHIAEEDLATPAGPHPEICTDHSPWPVAGCIMASRSGRRRLPVTETSQ